MSLLEQVLVNHASDVDGGYAAVAELREKMAELADVERECVVAELVSVALSDEVSQRGVALEVVAQEGTALAARTLYAGLAAVGDESWKRELVRTVMRLGYAEQSAELQRYVVGRLPLLEGGDLTLMGAFANVDPQASAQIAAEFWISMEAAGKAEAFLAYLPSLLINYAKVGPGLIGEMLQLVASAKPIALTELRNGISAYLEKPWSQKQLGLEGWQRIRASVVQV